MIKRTRIDFNACLFLIRGDSMEKSKIGDRIYDVITPEEYNQNKESLNLSFTAIKDKESQMVYPIRGKNDDRPGIYMNGLINIIKDPEDGDPEYSVDNIINFDDAKSLKEVIEKQSELKSMERIILTNPDNIFTPRIGENDSPEMVGLKKAVIAKHIDLDKYSARFGNNYSNDKRLFNDDTITMSKLKTMFQALDIKATLIIEDKNDSVPNPIGEQIIVELAGGTSNE